jgi:hypothetical protein
MTVELLTANRMSISEATEPALQWEPRADDPWSEPTVAEWRHAPSVKLPSFNVM